MGKFYQAKPTQGIYDASANSFTVNQDDRVLIGYQALTPKELEDASIDASEDVISARYSVGVTKIELDIDSGAPCDVTLTATQDVAMSPIPKNLAKPLEIIVRRRSGNTLKAVGQQRDPGGCWAASLSYWLSVADGRQERSFVNLLGDFNGLWDTSGFIKVVAFAQQIAKQSTRYRMTTERIAPKRLSEFIGRWPLLIGFKHPGGFGHMNVLTGYDESSDLFRSMDPWFPDPPPNCFTRLDGLVIFNGNEGDFTFRGGIVYKPSSYFQSAMASGTIFVGYPSEYKKHLP